MINDVSYSPDEIFYRPAANNISEYSMTVVLGEIERSPLFRIGEGETFGVLSHVEHIPTGRLVGFIGDSDLELVCHKSSRVDHGMEGPRAKLLELFSAGLKKANLTNTAKKGKPIH